MSPNMLIETTPGFGCTGADCIAWMRICEAPLKHLAGLLRNDALLTCISRLQGCLS